VRASGTFPTRSAADDALADYLTQWHSTSARGRVTQVACGFLVLVARSERRVPSFAGVAR
jgi:hypothetical protein